LRVLIAEDELDLNSLLVKKLTLEGYAVDSCINGEEAWEYVQISNYDAIILDIMMPKMNGFELLEKIRSNNIEAPVLFLTARDEIDDRVKGLDFGADDYLVKPFSFKELTARIRAMMRRKGGKSHNIYMVSDLVVNIHKHTVTRAGRMIDLSSKEFSILEYMIRNKGIVLSRDRIEEHVWSYDYEGSSNMVDVYIRYLRKKIDENFKVKLIHTVRGVGYVLKEG
jgi:DNA-binding response OmpR family regulator